MMTRSELYELVWTKPILQLAEELGISDRGLSKKCKRHKVPVPYRGYWAKMEAGKKARKYPLPKNNDESLDCIYFVKEKDSYKALEKIIDFPMPDEVLNKLDSFDIHSEYRKRHELITPTRKSISKKRTDRYGYALLSKEGLSLKVTQGTLERSIELFSHIITYCNHMGWEVLNRHGKTCIEIEGQKIAIRVKEKIKQVKHELTEKEKHDQKRWSHSYAPKHDYLSTGELSIEIDQCNSYDQKSVWTEKKNDFKEQMKDLLIALWTIAQWSYESKLIRNQEHAEYEIEAQERAKKQHLEKIAKNRINNLENTAKSWKEIQNIKAFLEDANSRATESSQENADALKQWIKWAAVKTDEMHDSLLKKAVEDDHKILNDNFYSW